MHTRSRQFILLFLLLSFGSIALMLAINYSVDPYLIHQWNSPALTQKHGGRERLSAWGKTYALARLKPSVVYVGNSRTELGLPVDMPLLGGQTVFNAALSGASLLDSADMLRHAALQAPLHTVIWGVDFPSFSTQIGNTEFERELIGLAGSQRLLLDLRRALSIDMTQDSLSQLLGRSERVCLSSLALAGQRDEACVARRIAALGGTAAVMQPRLQEFLQGTYPTPAAMALMRESLQSLCRQKVRTLLYVNPTHAMSTVALFRAGYGPAYTRWLRQLSDDATHLRRHGCDVRAYDFSGISTVTVERVPRSGEQGDMQYYWETSHYRRNVGRLILQRMLSNANLSAAQDFGVELTADTLEQHLRTQQTLRQRYLVTHPYEARLVEQALLKH